MAGARSVTRARLPSAFRLTARCLLQAEALPSIQVACAAAWSRSHDTRLRDGAIKGWDAAGVAPGAADASYDWTFTTPYAGSVAAGAPGAPPPQWRPVDERIDRTLLLSRDPILFFDELTLYESELDDNGAMSLTVKARQPLHAVCTCARGCG